jgi:hypothetical protein
MAVQHLDAARTTNLPVMDLVDLVQPMQGMLETPTATRKQRAGTDAFDDAAAAATPAGVSPALAKGTRISIYWTEMDEWFACTILSTRMEKGDDGRPQRATHVQYDAQGAWATCGPKNLQFWHCLDDERWQPEHEA